ncbi:MAG TPA: nuclear transport factor 2 family protein [Pyrinomonadaceae bacterium]|jgi:uncharacterized protein (TIGR02246 family)|nr:nuclear transport factor 2 family protein [Pyrinomonadaceae bacterium]
MMRKSLILAVLVVLASASLTPGQTKGDKSAGNSKTEREILKLMDDWIEALKRQDAAALDRLFADDFHIIESDGRMRDKEQELAPVKSGDTRFEHLSVEDVKVFIYGNTAIATGIGTYKGTYKGRAFENRERFFDVYQKLHGRWKILASRPTPLEKPASASAPD